MILMYENKNTNNNTNNNEVSLLSYICFLSFKDIKYKLINININSILFMVSALIQGGMREGTQVGAGGVK